MTKYEVRTFLRPNVLDQQGQAVLRALNTMGWDSVVNCRIGKIYEIDYSGEEDINKIAKSVYNEVMEDYEIKVLKDNENV